MEFFDVVKERHSVRVYTSQSLEAEKLQQILEAINQAPSAGNLQAYEVYLVCEAKRKTALAQATHGQEFLAQAAAILVFCAHAARSAGKYGKRGSDLYCLQDATIACTFAMLAATALGLSTVWVGALMKRKPGGRLQPRKPIGRWQCCRWATRPRLRAAAPGGV